MTGKQTLVKGDRLIEFDSSELVSGICIYGVQTDSGWKALKLKCIK